MARESKNFQDYTGSNRGKNTAAERAAERKANIKSGAKGAAVSASRGAVRKARDLRNVSSSEKPTCMCACNCRRGINPRKQTHCGRCGRGKC